MHGQDEDRSGDMIAAVAKLTIEEIKEVTSIINRSEKFSSFYVKIMDMYRDDNFTADTFSSIAMTAYLSGFGGYDRDETILPFEAQAYNALLSDLRKELSKFTFSEICSALATPKMSKCAIPAFCVMYLAIGATPRNAPASWVDTFRIPFILPVTADLRRRAQEMAFAHYDEGRARSAIYAETGEPASLKTKIFMKDLRARAQAHVWSERSSSYTAPESVHTAAYAQA